MSIAVIPLNVVTFQHQFKKPNSRLLKVRKDALRAEAQAAFPTVRCGLSLTRHTFSFYLLCFASQGQFHIELLEIPHAC